jgi:hypothetical protein
MFAPIENQSLQSVTVLNRVVRLYRFRLGLHFKGTKTILQVVKTSAVDKLTVLQVTVCFLFKCLLRKQWKTYKPNRYRTFKHTNLEERSCKFRSILFLLLFPNKNTKYSLEAYNGLPKITVC